MKIRKIPWFIFLLGFIAAGCYKPGPRTDFWKVSGLEDFENTVQGTSTLPSYPQATRDSGLPISSPTPNPPSAIPTLRTKTLTYTVQRGDSLGKIAQRHQITVEQIITANDILNPDQIEVGQVLLIPPPLFVDSAPAFKIIPDSELVYSPSNAYFDIEQFVEGHAGYLATYSEEVDEVELGGAEIVQRVSVEYSVNPRLLLTILEYQSSWVTDPTPEEETHDYPLAYFDPWRKGLYQQLGFAADKLNEGYYLWKIDAIGVWTLTDGSAIKVDPTINAGTAGVLNLMRFLTDKSGWDQAISNGGIFAEYRSFFGYPFDYAFEPLIPEDLSQPALQLPFETGDVWSYTGGPHGGWNSGSAWAALDFAPPGDALGCFPSSAWVVAAAPGLIVYSDHGAVIQDLDGDGVWQTGWSILYMHIDPWQRVAKGTELDAGDRIGHPSCEGGFSTGTHLHIARRYNGEWIAADGDLPMIMDGWVSAGYGVEYDGYLIKGDWTLEAWNGRSSLNAIQR